MSAMAVGGSLQPLYELGVVNNHVWPKPLKGSEMKGRCNFPGILLSSFSLQQDFWSLHVSGSIHRRTNQYTYSHNCFICRSFTISSIVQDIPILKSTTLALTRSFNIILGGPLPLRLAPAIGIIVFSVWGFGLMCYGRNIFQNDNNSKKTGTHFAFDSYLQPLLFWTGAILVCRTMDSIVLPSKASQAVKQRLLTFVRSSSTVLTFALCLSCLIQRTQKFFMKKNSSSDDARNLRAQRYGISGQIHINYSLKKVVGQNTPLEEMGIYWGYKVRYAPNFSSVFKNCPYKESYDYIVGTSEHGAVIKSSELSLPNFQHLLIAFGGLGGLEESIEEDNNLKGKSVNEVFHSYLNTCPNQGSRTIRTEEAIFISLQYFQEPIIRAGRIFEASRHTS